LYKQIKTALAIEASVTMRYPRQKKIIRYMYCAVIDATHIYEVYVDTLALLHELLGVHCNISGYEHTDVIQNLVYELIQ
jgi:hypothetical protein